MELRYLINAETHKVQDLEKALHQAGIVFDPRENLCAMPIENYQESIFQGKDLDWLPGAANTYLEEMDSPHRFREDMDQVGDIEALYEFLSLMTVYSDWHKGHSILEINPGRLEEFQTKYPRLMEDPTP